MADRAEAIIGEGENRLKIVLVGNYAEFMFNFRGPLLAELVKGGHEVIACAPGENAELAHKLKGIGVGYHSYDLERTGINPLKDIKTYFQLKSFFLKTRPDIVLSYTIKPVIYASLAAKMAGVSRIYSMITGLGYAFSGGAPKQKVVFSLACLLYRISLSVNQAVFFQNPDDLKLFQSLRIVDRSTPPVLINGSGVDLEYFAEVRDNLDSPVFLLIARMLKDKGIIEYAEAAKELKAKYPQAVFRLVGPFYNNPTAIQESELRDWQESGVVEYLGETKDVRPFIAGSSIFVLPSYREGTPRTVLEAMAMGRPIITTDAPGCRETVIEGENGFMVQVKDSHALARAMERFIVQPEIIGVMGKRSREIAEEKYDVNKVNGVILSTMGLCNEKAF